jgi:hypothetical protein
VQSEPPACDPVKDVVLDVGLDRVAFAVVSVVVTLTIEAAAGGVIAEDSKPS